MASSRDLLLRKGYAGTTVDEICAHAGLSKGCFYHSFGSKEQLGLATLEAFFASGRATVARGLERSKGTPQERAHAFLEFMEQNAESWWSRGCLMGSFAVELAESNPSMQKRVSEMFSGLASALADVLEPALRQDVGVSGVDLAEQLLASIEGGIVLAKAHGDPSRIRQSVKYFRRHFETLI